MSDPNEKPGDEVPEGTEGAGDDLCPDCGGSGQRDGGPCPTCDGTGTIEAAVGGG